MALAHHVICLTAVATQLQQLQSVQLALAQEELIAQHANLDMFYSLHLHGDAKLAMFQIAKSAQVVDQLILLVILAKMASMEVVQPHALVAQVTARHALVQQFVQHAHPPIAKMEGYAMLLMLLAVLLMLTEHVVHAVLDMSISAVPVQPVQVDAKIAPP